MRVERKKGEWLQDNIERKGTGANQFQALKSTGTTLADIGITKDESADAQKIASIPEENIGLSFMEKRTNCSTAKK